jgi:hypothetical protein
MTNLSPKLLDSLRTDIVKFKSQYSEQQAKEVKIILGGDIMFRELLESNKMLGKVCRFVSDDKTTGNFVDINGTEYSHHFQYNKWINNEDENLEYICMQYCIENGVKLEWFTNVGFEISGFGNKPKWHLQHHKKGNIIALIENDIIKEISQTYIDNGDYEQMKLVCAIFAHDIKIIAT